MELVLEFLSSVFRNFTLISDIIDDNNNYNSEFLRIQIPKLADQVKIFSELFSHSSVDENLHFLLFDIICLLRNQLLICDEYLLRFEECDSLIQLPVIKRNFLGRLKINVPSNQIVMIKNSGISWSKISRILNISLGTLYNFRCHNNLENIRTHRIVSDDELQAIVEIKTEHPPAGYKYVWAALKSKEIFVTWKRLKLYLRAIDPIGVWSRRKIRLKKGSIK